MDIYYDDTKKAMNAVLSEDWSFLHPDLKGAVEDLANESEQLLDQYKEKQDRIQYLEAVLEEHEIEYL